MRDSNFFPIYGWIVNRLRLSGNECLLFALLFNLCQREERQGREGKAEISITYASESLGIDKRNIQRIIEKLISKGFIEKANNSGKKNIYQLSTKAKEQARHTIGKMPIVTIGKTPIGNEKNATGTGTIGETPIELGAKRPYTNGKTPSPSSPLNNPLQEKNKRITTSRAPVRGAPGGGRPATADGDGYAPRTPAEAGRHYQKLMLAANNMPTEEERRRAMMEASNWYVLAMARIENG